MYLLNSSSKNYVILTWKSPHSSGNAGFYLSRSVAS